jgi:hypothetical protein
MTATIFFQWKNSVLIAAGKSKPSAGDVQSKEGLTRLTDTLVGVPEKLFRSSHP